MHCNCDFDVTLLWPGRIGPVRWRPNESGWIRKLIDLTKVPDSTYPCRIWNCRGENLYTLGLPHPKNHPQKTMCVWVSEANLCGSGGIFLRPGNILTLVNIRCGFRSNLQMLLVVFVSVCVLQKLNLIPKIFLFKGWECQILWGNFRISLPKCQTTPRDQAYVLGWFFSNPLPHVHVFHVAMFNVWPFM